MLSYLFVATFCCILISLLSTHHSKTVTAQSVAVSANHDDHNNIFANTLTRFAFGSCNHGDRPQPFWPILLNLSVVPSVFVWIGDVVYADAILFGKIPFIRFRGELPDIQKKYDEQAQHQDYKRFREKVYEIGTWDDHDYGENDGGIDNVVKEGAQKIFLDFIKEPPNTIRRQQQGVYTQYVFGPPDKRILFLLLDVRYFQDLGRGDMLGDEQWRWLTLLFEPTRKYYNDKHQRRHGQQQTSSSSTSSLSPSFEEPSSMSAHEQAHHKFGLDLLDHPPSLVIIGSGLQFVATNKMVGEAWRSFPRSRARIMHMIASVTRAWTFIRHERRISENVHNDDNNDVTNKNIDDGDDVADDDGESADDAVASLWLTGDIHMSEISETYVCLDENADNADNDDYFHRVLDITSSGLTHSWMTQIPLLHHLLPYSLHSFLLSSLFRFFVLDRSLSSSSSSPSFYLDRNVGLMDVSWAAGNRSVTVRVLGVSSRKKKKGEEEEGREVLQRRYSFEELAPRKWRHLGDKEERVKEVCRREVERASTVPFVVSGLQTAAIAFLIIILETVIVTKCFLRFCRANRKQDQHQKQVTGKGE